jgi:hypothetical protein
MSVPADQVVPQQSTGGKLADLLGNVNRPALNSFVATSQARNGLVSAQTQDALIKAQQAQEAMTAHAALPGQIQDAVPGIKGSEAALLANMMTNISGGAENAAKFVAQMKLMYGTPAEQVSGAQGFQGHLQGPVAVPAESEQPVAPLGGSPLGPPTQTPLAAAQTAAANATANLHQNQSDNPQLFHPAQTGTVSPEGQAALTRAVTEGRLDPTRVNSRTAPILAQMELQTPGTNYNRMHADAALQSNSTFQQRAMSVDMLPGLLQNVTSLGKKLNDGAGYNDLKSVGTMQQWVNGQTNDPAYTEYMTARNDTLLRLASVMRGVGMSDQAHTAEVEAMSPTLAPYALDAWLKGQMSVVNPMLERQNRITHLGEAGGGTPALSASPSAPAAPMPTPLGERIPGGGPAAAGPATLPSYPSEQAALAAGHKPGDRVNIGGVNGTLQ